MTDSFFRGLFDSATAPTISLGEFLLCVVTALVLGLALALCYTYRTRYTKSFIVTLALLPAVVCVVIMMVNGNVGAGVAVAGAFSLVRFRSVPGTAREITMLFLAMGAGLICGMGYLGFAGVFTLLLGLLSLVYARLDLGQHRQGELYKTLTITIPEDPNYTQVFEDIFDEFTVSRELVRVKTTNMGSMFRLTYHIKLKDPTREKELLDELRCRNGNLELSLARQETAVTEL